MLVWNEMCAWEGVSLLPPLPLPPPFPPESSMTNFVPCQAMRHLHERVCAKHFYVRARTRAVVLLHAVGRPTA
jgi:hypothetical protein